MNKQEFRSFLNVPERLPDAYRIKLTQDLVMVPLFYSKGFTSLVTFIHSLDAQHLSTIGVSQQERDDLFVDLTRTNILRDSVNPFIARVVDKQPNDMDANAKTLVKFLYAFTNSKSVNSFLDSWWSHKKNFVSILSTYPGWSDKNFALKVSGSTSNGLDYLQGTSLFVAALNTGWRRYGISSLKHTSFNGFSSPVIDKLQYIIGEVFRIVVLDNVKVKSTRDAYLEIPFNTLSGDVMSYKSLLYVQKHLELYPVSAEVDGKYIDLYEKKYGFKFKDIVSRLFFDRLFEGRNDTRYHNSGEFDHNEFINMSLSALLVQLRANKPNLNKQVVVKKLLRFILELKFLQHADYRNAHSVSYSEVDTILFSKLVDDYAVSPNLSIYCNTRFKVRRSNGSGFDWTNHPSWEQVYQKLIECFSPKTVKETFVINLHPVAQLFSSYMSSATSCHNMVDLRRHGDNHSSLGMYHTGQFQAAAAGGFIVAQYDDMPDDKLCFTPLKYRAQLYINPELDMIRQHLAYPGRNNDELAKAEAKTYRNIIHQLLTPWHGFGTEGWLASKPNGDDDSVGTNGYNWDRSSLNKRGDTLRETRGRAGFFGYGSESTFAFSHVIYPEPHNFVLPIASDHFYMTRYETFEEREGNFFFYSEGSFSSFHSLQYLFDNGTNLTNEFNFRLTHGTWKPTTKPLFVKHNEQVFVITEDMPHGVCEECKTIIFSKDDKVCSQCHRTSSSNLFSKMVARTEDPIYFNYKTDDDLTTFLTNVNRTSNIVWKNADSLISFLPSGTKFILVLKDGKLSVKVTKPKDTDNIIDVSSVVFE